MGWWSVTIMGGDLPLDILDDIKNLTELEDLYPLTEMDNSTRTSLKNKLDNNLDVWTDVIVSKYEEDDQNVALQVLAVISMSCGATIPEPLKIKFIAAAKKDEWANSIDSQSSDRKKIMGELVEKLEKYQEIPTFIAEELLFDKITNNDFSDFTDKDLKSDIYKVEYQEIDNLSSLDKVIFEKFIEDYQILEQMLGRKPNIQQIVDFTGSSENLVKNMTKYIDLKKGAA